MKSKAIVIYTCQQIILCSSVKSAAADTQEAYNINDFTGGYFKIVSKEPGIYNLNMGFEGDLGLNEKPMAYGYLNGDSNNDIVTMSTGAKKELYIYTYDKDLFKFVRSNTVPLAAIGSNTVMSVILTDIDYDNKVDLVVTCINNDNSLNSTIYVFSKIGNDYVANNDYMIQNIRKQQPVVFTMYDNNKNSAVYTTYLLVQGNTDNVRACYYIDRNDNNKMTHRPFSELLNTKDTTHCLSQSNVDGFTLNPYLGSSFVDMNADCRPDLLLNSLGDGAQKQQEIYLYTNDGFCLVNVQSMPSQITMPSFLDLNNRGTNDMAFITQVNGNTNNIRVNVLRNKYTTDVNKGVLCTQNQINLENPYPGLKDIMQQNKGSDEWRYSYDLETNKYLYQDPENMATPPLALLGDLDLDGIMDLVLVETTENENNRSQARVVAYKGIKCSEDTAKIIFGKEVYTAELQADCRYFSKAEFEKKSKNGQTTYFTDITTRTSFFDFGDQGAFSMISESYDENTKVTSVKTYYNFLNNNNYFLKSSARTNGKQAGDSFIGTNYIAVRTEMNGSKSPVSMAQQYGMSHTRMQLPYVIFGLGRINNYIEDFTAGVTSPENDSHSWSPIIPNSQLIITPPKNKDEWKIEIYINPTKAMALIIISTLIVLFVIGLVIIIFHIKEKEQDRKDNEVMSFMPW